MEWSFVTAVLKLMGLQVPLVLMQLAGDACVPLFSLPLLIFVSLLHLLLVGLIRFVFLPSWHAIICGNI